MRRFLSVFLLLPWALQATLPAQGQTPEALTHPQAQALVKRALAAELIAAQDKSHPMRFRLRKTSPRLTSTKEIIETKDGAVARLVSLFGKPLPQDREQAEQARLDALFNDPDRQKHREQGEEGDMAIVLKLLRMLPDAYLYEYAGAAATPAGIVQNFTFRPNPNFTPPDFESKALTALAGEIQIDAAEARVTRLEGHLQQDTDYGWGLLGKLDQGGWIVIEQTDVGANQWRIARFKMKMSLRVLFKDKSFDTTEEMTQYAPVPLGIGYRQAIEMLRSNPASR